MNDKMWTIEECLATEMRNALESGLNANDVPILGELTDMLKDLGEYEYYHSVAEAMKKTNNRYGFLPQNPNEQYWMDMLRSDDVYNPNPYIHRGGSSSTFDDEKRFGKEYGQYEQYKRHYTTTKSADDKREMDEHAKKHLMDMMISIKDIWHDADPELRKRIKMDITNLANELT